MANPLRGEVAVVLDGQAHLARLTLGALAGLEAELDADGLAGLAARLDQGLFSSRDILAVVTAGLRGGGWQGAAPDLIQMQIDGGPMQAARIAARLLALAFRSPE